MGVEFAGRLGSHGFPCSLNFSQRIRFRFRLEYSHSLRTVSGTFRPGPPAGADYYQTIVNPAGSHLDCLARRPADWNPRLRIATFVDKDYWSVEVEIGFSWSNMPAERAAGSVTAPRARCVPGRHSSHRSPRIARG